MPDSLPDGAYRLSGLRDRSGFVGRIRRSRHPAINARTSAIQQNAGIKKPPGEGRLKDKAGKPALNSRH